MQLQSVALRDVAVVSAGSKDFWDGSYGLVQIVAPIGANTSSVAGISNVALNAIDLGPTTCVLAADGFHSVAVENVTASQVKSEQDKGSYLAAVLNGNA